MLSDGVAVLQWWVTLLILGLCVLPITKRLFHRFIDEGYIFSKVIGILLLSWITWVMGVGKILPFFRESLIVVLLGIGAINLWLYISNKKKVRETQTNIIPKIFMILEEILFLIGLSFWSYVRATESSIRGLEKFMDFGFVQSILRSTYFPPLDMWLTKSPDYTGGYFINYYYFGHLIMAVLTKLSNIDSVVTYNLMIATLFALTFTLSFSLGSNMIFLLRELKNTVEKINIKRILVGGFLAGFLVTFAGNLHTIYTFTTGYPNDNPVPFWNLEFGYHPETYWYPNATRFIPYTIHEFPLYSFVVADLHGHVSDIPFVLLTLALLLNLLVKTKTEKDNTLTHEAKIDHSESPYFKDKVRTFLEEFKERTSVSLPYLFLLSLLLSVMYMTNALDGLIYMALTSLTILYLNHTQKKGILSTLYQTFSACLFIVFFFLITNLPFSWYFKPFGTGIGVLCAPVELLGKHFGPLLFEEGKCQKSPLWMLMTLWGFFYFSFLGFIGFILIPFLRNVKTHGHKALPVVDIFVILTSILSTLLLIFPEFFYVKDIYPMHYRANTMFKLGYQAFMMMALNSSYILLRIKPMKTGIAKVLYLALFLLLFFLVGIYPFFAINSYYGGLKTYKGLDGLTWMKREYPSDYEAVKWLRQNIQGQPVILEANGESYTDYGRFSSNTGLPTIIGWPVHEWLWRGSYDEAGRRIPEVQTLYESKDIRQTQTLLEKYNVSLVIIGQLEKQKYPTLDEEKWNSLGTVVFTSGSTKIYEVK